MARTPAKTTAAPDHPAATPVRPEGIGRNALVILAVIATAGALYWTRGILTPLALAMFLAIMIDSFARRLEHRWPRLPDSLSLAVAIVLSLLIFGVTLVVVADRAGGFIGQLVGYGPKIDGLIARMAGAEDRRQSPVAITEKGIAALNHDMRRRDAWLAASMAKRLAPTECEILRLAAQLMERLAAPREE